MLQKSFSRAAVLIPAFVLLIGCSSEQGADEISSVEVHTDTVDSEMAEAVGFEVLDSSPVNLLTDTRLQIINYWASWCLPCIEEMPELAAFRNKHNDAVEVYAVNYDRLNIDQLRQEITTLGVEIPALVEDPHEVLGYQRPDVLPTTVVMLEGQIKDVLVGPQDMETLEAVLETWEK